MNLQQFGNTISVGNVEVKILTTTEGIRLSSVVPGIILSNVFNEEAVIQVLQTNFDIVFNHYMSKLTNALDAKTFKIDINILSLNIVFYWMYVYNLPSNIDAVQRRLAFKGDELDSVTTQEKVYLYFKRKFKNWKEISALLLDMTLEKFEQFYNNREEYNRMF